MIPSLVARELKDALVEYLATTFALTDDAAYAALSDFLLDDSDGIFRGPYLRVRLPFVDAPVGADTGLLWTPPGFQPYVHQLTAWRRLAGRDGGPRSTLITTGTGSGKSEAFLMPIADHCLWARRQGIKGVKALILYPMNALVVDQQRRIAQLLSAPDLRAAGVTGGVWIGNDGTGTTHSTMSDEHLITDHATLLGSPPDILLTNYKMLDRLLTNESRQRLWALNTPPEGASPFVQPLKYLVLDELHTYDGAQGTDVAMLLRRLGHRLGISDDVSPLAGVACIGTSATLGSSAVAGREMCAFAEKVFGQPFDEDAIIGETRLSVDEVCPDLDLGMPVPDVSTVSGLRRDDLDGLANVFTATGFDDAQAVGERLLRHPITAALLHVASAGPRSWGDVVLALSARIPEWATATETDPEAVAIALERFVGLVSCARGRSASGGDRPLFAIEVQVWIREVTRLARSVSTEPAFHWSDSPGTDPSQRAVLMPAVYCTSCGRSGWMAVANMAAPKGHCAIERLDHGLLTDTYSVAVHDRHRTRTLMSAGADEQDILWLDMVDGQLYAAAEGDTRLPVLVGGMTGDIRTLESRDAAAKLQICPACGTRDAVRFLGSRVTTLASVGITQMFGSDAVADDERKLLAFTDSVQDASHRAAFFAGRTHRFNLRAIISGALQRQGKVPLPAVATTVLAVADADAKPRDAIFSLIPPDLVWDDWLAAAWREHGKPEATDARAAIEMRLSFDAVLEAGLRSRLGRTLETTGTAIAEVRIDPEEWSRVESFVTESLQANAGQMLVEPAAIRAWVHGVIERVRQRGGIFHPFLDEYVRTNGKRWHIWGGAVPIAPKFPAGISAPSFLAQAASDEFDPIVGPQSWMVTWTRKLLGVNPQAAELVISDLLNELVAVGVFERRVSDKGSVWGIPASRIDFVDIPDGPLGPPSTELRCAQCSHRHFAAPDAVADWVDRSCSRPRCGGQFVVAPVRPSNYYRNLYRRATIRRVVAAEHTSLLTQRQRETIEDGFKRGDSPDSPNVLAATPTLEMGIDIGDLSSVMLTAVPPTQANYVQRVGRAGRKTGNAFVTTFVEADPRSLYFMNEPEQMIAGDIAAPSCYLDAIEILRRQYLAFLVDQAARRGGGLIPDIGEMPRMIGQLATKGIDPGGWMTALLGLGVDTDLVLQFVELFGPHLDSKVAVRLAKWAEHDMADHVLRRLHRWKEQVDELRRQQSRLRDRKKELEELANPSEEDQALLGRVAAEQRYLAGRISSTQNDDTLGALEALGLMPNYTLYDDTVELEVNLWHVDYERTATAGGRRIETTSETYQRAATVAIRELAPGNHFYVRAHKVRIDSVDVGLENSRTYSQWRLCPRCGWATRDAARRIEECDRCGTAAIADNGQILTVLPMRRVSSTEREISARVADDSEEREREWHEMVTTVDIDPVDIDPGSAVLHAAGVTFGVEAARSATIRHLNLGIHGSRSVANRPVAVAGQQMPVSLFTVCTECGGVLGVRGDVRNSGDPAHHRTWCKVRSGARGERWEAVALAHELDTEAVRILIPVAEFEASERTQSFKAALMLGLRDSFGGDPDHLRIVDSDFPAADDPSERVRYIVVHDTVPGGTGYLLRLADPARLERILRRSRDLIANCSCRLRGRTGCHKCLYHSARRSDIPLVSRHHALSILDEILTDWSMAPAPNNTITGINLSGVRQSELERMFKAVLHLWATARGVTIASAPDPANPRYVRYSLRFASGAEWTIREQVTLHAHNTVPDFLAERVDRPGTDTVAIYLDGWAFHGAKPDDTDDDAIKRSSLRSAGFRVWTLTWEDVDSAHKALTTGGQQQPVLPLTGPMLHQARTLLTQMGGEDHPAHDAVHRSGMDQLMLHLEHPDADVWRKIAQAVGMAAATGAGALWVEDRLVQMDCVARGEALSLASHDTGKAALSWASTGGFGGTTFLEGQGVGATIAVVLSLDTANGPTRHVWSDWLHLGNLIQFVDEHGVITTTRTYLGGTRPTAPTRTRQPLDDALDQIFDPMALELGRVALAAGHGDFVVGAGLGDADDTPSELLWESRKVAVVAATTPVPTMGDGWVVKASSDWTPQDLLTSLERVVE